MITTKQLEALKREHEELRKAQARLCRNQCHENEQQYEFNRKRLRYIRMVIDTDGIDTQA